MNCEVEGCERQHHAKGLCQHHYDQTPERLAHFRAKHHADPAANYKRTIRRLKARIKEREAQFTWFMHHLDMEAYAWQRLQQDLSAPVRPSGPPPRGLLSLLFDPAVNQRKGHR